MPEFLIRLAEPDDVPWLEDVERSAAKAFSVLDCPLPNGSPTVPQSLLMEMAGRGKLWVACNESGKIIGFVGCRDMDDILYVHEISVAYAFQKQGAGRSLMQAVLDEATVAGYPAVGLTTSRDIVWNFPFYETFGFREIAAYECPALSAQLQDEVHNGANPATRCAMIIRLDSR